MCGPLRICQRVRALSAHSRLALAFLLLSAGPDAWGGDGGLSDNDRFYREKIEPRLKLECFRCHSAEAPKLRGGLRLDSRAAMIEGGDTGPALVPGKPAESLLVQALRHQGGLSMPPKKPPLDEAIIADFEAWIRMGAPAPDGAPNAVAVATVSDEARHHWSFQPVRTVTPPSVRNSDWVRTPIDAFVLSKLEERHWQPAPAASRIEWIRRVSFDLTGLPPAPEEVDAFVSDASPAAFERVVDRLLDSPHYGERWGQHWLDLVRFAETEGYEYDRHIPEAWRYRDYVVRSLNDDKPFDRFVLEQLAGDEIAPDDLECRTASTFHRLGPVRRNAGNPDIALSRNEVLTERTDILGTTFLGLSVGCARCHNHKLEPIAQKDYYRLQAFVAATEEQNIVLAPEHVQKAWEEKAQKIKNEMQRLKKEAKLAKGAAKDELESQIEVLEDQLDSSLPTIPAVRNDFSKRTPIHVLKRGVWENKGELVGPRPPGILVPEDQPELAVDVADPRTRLARWLTSPDHPLTARVIVNRIWQQHFGSGLVKTLNDFGTKGDRPSHPELLDWLAKNLVQNGWHFKPIHRLLVLSSTYRQSSRSPSADEYSGKDPENRLHWRFSPRRLEAEEIRDAMLVASGRMNFKIGGPSVMVPVEKDLVSALYKPSQWNIARNADEYNRRSIYLIAKRNLRLPFMETFDAPALLSSCARRESSTHAPQALEMLNGRLSNEQADAFAARLERETGGSSQSFVDRAFRIALGRPPTDQESALALTFLREGSRKEFALAVFNLNGFLYVQ